MRYSGRVVLPTLLAGVATGAACRGPARSPFATADSLRGAARWAQATPRYAALADSFRRTNDTADLWRAELWYGDGLMRQGRQDSARVALERAMALNRGDPKREGWVRQVRSILLDRQGKFDSALVDASRSRELARTAGDRVLEAQAWYALGEIHSLSGHYRDAVTANQQQVALWRSLDRPRDIASALSNLGIDLRHLGRYDEARQAYEEALAIFRRLGGVEGQARVLYNLANTYGASGDVPHAVSLMTEAQHLAEQIQEPRGLGFIHNDLAELYINAGNPATARRHLEAALGYTRASGFVYGRIHSLEELGRLDLAEGRLEAADTLLREALTLADSTGFRHERAMVRAGLARTRAALQDARAARKWADAALWLADSLGDPEVQFEALAARAKALEVSRAHDPQPYLRAINLLESVRGRLALGDLRLSIAAPHTDVYEGAIRALLAQHRPVAAFEVAERARARMLLDLMAEGSVARAARTRADSVRQELRDRFAALAEARAATRPSIEAEINALTDSLAALERSAATGDARVGLWFPAPASLAAIRSGLLAPGRFRRRVLAFFWGERDAYGWWITVRTIHAARLGRADSLAALVEFLRATIDGSSPGAEWRMAALRAYDRLVAPLAPDSADAVSVVADGPLAYVPLEVLLPATTAAPWGANRRIVYGPSASVLLALAREPPPNAWSRALLAVGDPNGPGPGEDETLSASARSTTPGPLPYAAEEAREIAALFRDGGSDVLIGAAATRARWLSLDPAAYRFLHFAVHAVVSERQPDRTRLLLADQALDLAALRQLHLSAELVTLSACETALGRRVAGEGVVGLPHAFLAAGARGAVVTLWRVGDRSAADFMEAFYRALKAGRLPADALLEVRRSWIARGGSRGEPSEWAPFILVGAVGPG